MKKLLFILPLLYYSCTDDIVADIDALQTENAEQDAQIDLLLTVITIQQEYIDSMNNVQNAYIDSLISEIDVLLTTGMTSIAQQLFEMKYENPLIENTNNIPEASSNNIISIESAYLIIMHSGEKFYGDIVEETNETIKLKSSIGNINLEISDILDIKKGIKGNKSLVRRIKLGDGNLLMARYKVVDGNNSENNRIFQSVTASLNAAKYQNYLIDLYVCD